MKILIIYSTMSGTSKQACEMLAESLTPRCESTMFNITDNPPSPDGFDAVVIGGSVKFGKLHKKLKTYIKQHRKALETMPSAAFICCGLAKDFDDYRIMQLPKDLKLPLGIHYFGGQLKPDRWKGMRKLIVSVMRQSILTQDPDKAEDIRYDLPEIMPDTIYALAQRILMSK